mmetsp:Transcript_108028/g.257890  ORF Transcript_108028/g.257890 Transcript_108028/m.257890 type:complete len:271 (+) Transcript_108028:336-1148(+)
MWGCRLGAFLGLPGRASLVPAAVPILAPPPAPPAAARLWSGGGGTRRCTRPREGRRARSSHRPWPRLWKALAGGSSDGPGSSWVEALVQKGKGKVLFVKMLFFEVKARVPHPEPRQKAAVGKTLASAWRPWTSSAWAQRRHGAAWSAWSPRGKVLAIAAGCAHQRGQTSMEQRSMVWCLHRRVQWPSCQGDLISRSGHWGRPDLRRSSTERDGRHATAALRTTSAVWPGTIGTFRCHCSNRTLRPRCKMRRMLTPMPALLPGSGTSGSQI